MRAYGHNHSHGPSWLVALAIFVGLLLLVQVFRGYSSGAERLEQQFAAERPVPGSGRVELPALPTLPASVSNLARTAAARIGAGSTGAALTPVAQSADLRVEIVGIRQALGGLQITGAATNTGQQPLPVSLADFRFTDGSGTVYAAENAAATTLEPGQRAPLDLTLPIQDPRQLTLEVQLAGQPPLQMVLIQSPE
jgi:hypothetical protein